MSFKCRVCGCEEYHIKKIPGGMESDTIIAFKNLSNNAIISLKTCRECRIVYSDWQDLDTSLFYTERDKKIVEEMNKEKIGEKDEK